MVGDSKNPLTFLSAVAPSILATALADEGPRVVGAVLASLSPPQATKVLANMTGARQREAVAAMRQSKQVLPAVLAGVAEVLKEKIGLQTKSRFQPRRVPDAAAVNSTGTRHEQAKAKLAQSIKAVHSSGGTGQSFDGMAVAAEILWQAPASVRRALQLDDPALYQNLRKRRFVFEDLIRTEARYLTEVFNTAEVATTALALRFSAPRLKQRVLAAVSPRRAEDIVREIESTAGHGRTRISDIEKAQEQTLDIALRLQQEGRIVIDPDDPEIS